MNFTNFWTALETLEKAIAVTSPSVKRVKAAYWGGPSQSFAPPDLPCVINSLSESNRTLGFGSRDQGLRVNVQMLVGGRHHRRPGGIHAGNGDVVCNT